MRRGMHKAASGGVSNAQELAPRAVEGTNLVRREADERPDNEKEDMNTYPFSCAVLEEVERARSSDDGSIVERCRIY